MVNHRKLSARGTLTMFSGSLEEAKTPLAQNSLIRALYQHRDRLASELGIKTPTSTTYDLPKNQTWFLCLMKLLHPVICQGNYL